MKKDHTKSKKAGKVIKQSLSAKYRGLIRLYECCIWDGFLIYFSV